MLIVCPNCKKRFDVDPGRGEEAKKLRCSNCRAVFRLVRKGAAEPPAQGGAKAASGREALPQAATPVPVQAPIAGAATGAGQARAAAASGPLKVVVANESAAFCDAVQKVLSSEPFEVVVCNDGKVALETVENIRPAILLLDVALPTIFGFEVCERVRQNPALSEVKIVLIASIYDKTRYKRSPNSLYGADEYIEKHHIPDSLVPMIYRLTSGELPPEQSAAASEAAEQTRAEIRQAEVRETTTDTAPPSLPLATEAQPPLETLSLDGNRYDNWQETFPKAFHAGAESASAAAESVAMQEILPMEEISFEELAAEVPPPAPPQPSEAEVKARRLARIIVSDIVLYNQGKVEQGVRDGSFYELLSDDIREGERLYRQRVPEHVRESTDFLKDAFEGLLAKKRAELRI